MEQKVNIVITDDHKLFRKGMRALLSDFDFIGDIYEAGNGVELLQLLESDDVNPDLILLDMRMPEMDGAETTANLQKLYPGLRIIILTMEDDAQLVLHMIKEGVNGYLLKNADPDELEKAIKMVIQNGFYFAESISEIITRAGTDNSPDLKSDFSDKELTVLEMVCKELTAPEIAVKLSLSVRTVEGYKRKLMEKTSTKNMAGLVIFAVKNNLVLI
ncbi:MAG: response regulator transcription factor [Bacteroidota bacterium]